MGCVNSTEFEAKHPAKKTKKRKTEQYEDGEPEIKLLLLGAGESGKSTILKQMKIIYEEGYGERERKIYRSIVYTNLIQSMVAILRAMEHLGIPFSDPTSLQDAHYFFQLQQQCGEGELPKELATVLLRLWSDRGVHECLKRSNEYHLNDSADYYLANIERICLPHYLPTQNDIVRTRSKTTGIIDFKFRNGDDNYRIVDVGGQRSERRKWNSAFSGVTAIIFCVALSEYDLRLEEDDEMNRLQESILLFKSICNYKDFASIPIILFLNKNDIFKEKIKKVPLKNFFPEYSGPNTYENAAAYIKMMFESTVNDSHRQIYTQFTNATDTENISFVFECCKEIFCASNLSYVFS